MKYVICFPIIHADVNECELGSDNCGADAEGTNTIGGFTCACNTGYHGEGETCEGKYCII